MQIESSKCLSNINEVLAADLYFIMSMQSVPDFSGTLLHYVLLGESVSANGRGNGRVQAINLHLPFIGTCG